MSGKPVPAARVKTRSSFHGAAVGFLIRLDPEQQKWRHCESDKYLEIGQ
jgi:hypothetical protein